MFPLPPLLSAPPPQGLFSYSSVDSENWKGEVKVV